MCKDNKCPFKIVAATSAKGSNGYTVKEHQCVLSHTCVASRPKITTTSTLDIEIKQAILSCGNVAKATIECREGGTVYEAFSRGGYDLHTGSAKAQRRSMVRVVKRVFRVDEMGTRSHPFLKLVQRIAKHHVVDEVALDVIPGRLSIQRVSEKGNH